MISRTAGVYHRPRKTLGVMRSDLGISGLNPYLLFDAESSMIGTFETPTLDLDPSVPSSLDVITAVRTGVATYTDESGLIQEATANTVRVDHSLGYPAMLIEPSATNLVPSKVFTANGTTTIASGFLAPDGAMDAYEVSNILNQTELDAINAYDGTIKKTTKICDKCGFPVLMCLKARRKPWFFCFNSQCESNKERIEKYRKKKEEDNNIQKK